MNPRTPPSEVSFDHLVEQHHAVFLDAYGVLVDGHGAIPGAREAIERLSAHGDRYLVLTNDASRLPETLEARFASFGLPIDRDHVLSSGDLIAPALIQHGLDRARVVVLGSGDSATFARRAGAEVITADPATPIDALVVCDESGYPLLETCEAVLSMLFAAVDAGRIPTLILANPDLIYPKEPGRFGFTAGTVAQMFENALAVRYPSQPGLRFERLGKPFAPIFDEACARIGSRQVVMVGDQLATDILGAHRAGIASALVTTGLTPWQEAMDAEIPPTFVLRSLA